MKMTKLLTGAAAIALLTGAAHAQYTIDNTALAGATFQLPAGTYLIASELNLTTAARTTTLAFELNDSDQALSAPTTDSENDFGSGSATLRVDLDGFLFNTTVASTDLTCADGTNTSTVTVTDGGTAGDNFVEFEIANVEFCTAGAVAVGTTVASNGQIALANLDMIYQGPFGNFTTSLTRTSTGAALDGGSVDYEGATSGTSILPLVVASRAVSVSNTSADRNEILASLASGFTTLITDTVGQIDIAVSDGTTGPALDFANTGVTLGTDVDIDLVINVPDDTGLDLEDLEFDGATGNVVGNTIEFSVALGNVGANQTVVIAEDADNPAAIIPQTVTADFEIDFNATLLSDSDGSLTVGSIDRQGDSDGPFEWTGDGNATTQSVFRHTGFDPDEALPVIRVIVDNAQFDGFDGEYILDTSGLSVSSGGEVITNSAILGDQIGDFGRADVTFFFEGTGFDTRRFLASSNGTLTTFDGDFGQACSGTTTAGDLTIAAITGVIADPASTAPAAGSGATQRADELRFGAGSATQGNGTVSMSCTQ